MWKTFVKTIGFSPLDFEQPPTHAIHLLGRIQQKHQLHHLSRLVPFGAVVPMLEGLGSDQVPSSDLWLAVHLVWHLRMVVLFGQM